MNERLKMIRESLNLNMRDFSDRLGMSHGAISLLESGKRNFTSQFITSLCREYGVNETWFRTGEGEMFGKVTREQKIASIAATILQDDNDFRAALVDAIIGLDKDQLAVLQNIADKMLENYKKNNEE